MIIVTNDIIEEVFTEINTLSTYSLDTETTGLKPFHGDKIIAIIIATCKNQYYIDLYEYNKTCIDRDKLIKQFNLINNFDKTWFMHNAKFDLHFMKQYLGIDFNGTVICTKILARLINNQHKEYNLDFLAQYYLKEGKNKEIEPYKKKFKNRFYMIPLDILSKYGCKDAEITYKLGEKLLQNIDRKPKVKGIPDFNSVVTREIDLLEVVKNIEERGLLIDIDYLNKAISKEESNLQEVKDKFRHKTGKELIVSNLLFQEIFKDQKDKWVYTEKGNPSFNTENLVHFKGEIADLINSYREHKNKIDFYNSFFEYKDKNNIIHPSLVQDGTATGRFCSKEPNFQNLKNTEEKEEFSVRGVIIPRKGYKLVSIDYQAMEMRLMLFYSKEKKLIEEVIAGKDIHQATADLMGVTRSEAKSIGFGLIYGMGTETLAQSLKCSVEEAKAKKDLYFSTLPNVKIFSSKVVQKVRKTGFLVNALGRIVYLPSKEKAYKGINYLIQGLGADIIKEAMVRINKYLDNKKSKLIFSVHDELMFEIHETELGIEKELKNIMDNIIESDIPIISEITYYKDRWGNEEE